MKLNAICPRFHGHHRVPEEVRPLLPLAQVLPRQLPGVDVQPPGAEGKEQEEAAAGKDHKEGEEQKVSVKALKNKC